MKIGAVEIAAPLALAPMAGVTDLAFRTICRRMGAAYTVTEMVSAKALCYQDKKSIPLMQLASDEHPAAVQLFGSDPGCMEEAAVIVLEKARPDILDINMGCPVPKVVKSGDGSALMRDPALAARVAQAVIRGAKGVPVTVKLRTGWDKGSVNCVEVALALQDAGVAAVAVHGRTRTQMYAGRADWNAIRAVKAALDIPVMANGDIFSGEDAAHILRYTGADMAMVGRGVFGNPWIFRDALAVLDGRPLPPPPSLQERCDTAMEQFRLAMEAKGEKIACLEARRHYAWYLKGVPHSGYWKAELCKAQTLEDLERCTKGILRDLS